MSLPVCGANKQDCLDPKQYHGNLTEPTRKSIRMAYSCPCANQGDSIGRYMGKDYKLADQTLDIIEKASGFEHFDTESRNLNCPWQSYKNPLWAEVNQYIRLKEIPGTTNINDSTDNIVYEGVLFYLSRLNSVEGYIFDHEQEKREKERQHQRMKNLAAKNKR